MPKTALVAIGGNSLIVDQSRPDIPHQWDAVRETCRHLADMIADGWTLVITHGNGPQVGFILRRNELAAHEVHSTPLDLIVADTQGAIGYMLQQALSNELASRGIKRKVATIVTQILVAANDPAFANPTKPIGSFLDEGTARLFEEQGWRVVEDAGRGWRRVVASPKPLRVVEKETILDLIAADTIVIAAGGGGIPVVQNRRGELRETRGVPAVIDKDLASGLLARQVKADLFLISTGVEHVAINFKTPDQVDLARVTTAELGRYQQEGHFAKGSMQPKIEAAIQFVDKTGGEAIITNPTNLIRAVRYETGTRVVKG